MTFNKLAWLLVPLAVGFGCASSQQAQKPTKAGGSSTLVDEGPASAQAAQAGAAGAAGAAAAGQPGATQLVPFQGNGGFVVLMPPNPQRDEKTQDTPGGQVLVHIAQAQDPGGRYMSSASDFPAGSLSKIKPKDLLDSLQRATVQSIGGTLVSSRDVDVAGIPGREFTATDPQGSQVTARVFVSGSRVYTLAGTYPQGNMPSSIQQFLGSFQPPASAAVGGSGSDTGAGASSDSMKGSSPDSSTPYAPSTPSAPPKNKMDTRDSSSATGSGSSSGR